MKFSASGCGVGMVVADTLDTPMMSAASIVISRNLVSSTLNPYTDSRRTPCPPSEVGKLNAIASDPGFSFIAVARNPPGAIHKSRILPDCPSEPWPRS
jgi:hypothetical protein